MGVLTSFAIVLFIIMSVLLVIIILLQTDKSSGMGLLGGSSQSTFGSSTADVITKITAVMVGLFLVGSLGISALESVKLKSIEKSLKAGDAKAPGVIQESVPSPVKKDGSK